MSNSVCRPGATASPLSATITLSPGSCIAIYNTQHRAYETKRHTFDRYMSPPDTQWTAASKLMVIPQRQKCIWPRYYLVFNLLSWKKNFQQCPFTWCPVSIKSMKKRISAKRILRSLSTLLKPVNLSAGEPTLGSILLIFVARCQEINVAYYCDAPLGQNRLSLTVA